MKRLQDTDLDSARRVYVFPVSLTNGLTVRFDFSRHRVRDGDAILSHPPRDGPDPGRPAERGSLSTTEAGEPSGPAFVGYGMGADERGRKDPTTEDGDAFVRAYAAALFEESRRTREAARATRDLAQRVRAAAEERRKLTGLGPARLSSTAPDKAAMVEETRHLREAARGLRLEGELRRARSAFNPFDPRLS